MIDGHNSTIIIGYTYSTNIDSSGDPSSSPSRHVIKKNVFFYFQFLEVWPFQITRMETLFNQKRPSKPTINTTQIEKPTFSVSNPPTKLHWMPDSSTNSCSSCNLKFNLFWRRHHCRKCGFIFCNNCCFNLAKIDHNCLFTNNGALSRVCQGCLNSRFAVLDKDVDLVENIDNDLILTPAAGIPEDWNWSSF